MDGALDVTIFGAGAIGLYVGAALWQNGHRVRWLVRDSDRGRAQVAKVHRDGVRVRGLEAGRGVAIPPDAAKRLFVVYPSGGGAILGDAALAALFAFEGDHPRGPGAARGDGPRRACVLVATKRGAALKDIHTAYLVPYFAMQRAHGSDALTPVVYLQNGIRVVASDVLDRPVRHSGAASFPYFPVEAVIGFNVAYDAASSPSDVLLPQSAADAHLVLGPAFWGDRRRGVRRATRAVVVAAPGASPPDLAAAFAEEMQTVALLARGVTAQDPAALGCTGTVVDAVLPYQCGKLILNLTNAVNALTGLGIGAMYRQAPCRLVVHACAVEAAEVFRAEGWTPAAAARGDGLMLRLLPVLLPLPSWLFVAAVGHKLKGRDDAHTSMAQDLAAARVPTEVRALNGAVAALGADHGYPCPANRRIVALVEAAEASVRHGGAAARPSWAAHALYAEVRNAVGAAPRGQRVTWLTHGCTALVAAAALWALCCWGRPRV